MALVLHSHMNDRTKGHRALGRPITLNPVPRRPAILMLLPGYYWPYDQSLAADE